MREAVVVLAERRGIVLVADAERRLHGVLTAGDLTRLMEHETDIFTDAGGADDDAHPAQRAARRAGERGGVSHGDPRHHGHARASTTADRLVGVVHLHDLMRARVA